MNSHFIQFLKSKNLNIQVNEESAKALIFELNVHAKPGARVEKIFVGIDGDLVIQTRARPVDGEANQAITEKVAAFFGVPKGRVQILRGEKSKIKRIKLLVEFTTKKTADYEKRINDFLAQEA